jgi:uncharacterized membrane protein YqjE
MTTEPNGRPISAVIRDIVQNIQDIVRSELRLAKTELSEEIGKAKGAGSQLGLAALFGFYAMLFALLAAVFALSMVVPYWAAALIVAAVMSLAAGIMYSSGRKRLRDVHPVPEHTVETMKANIQWAKQHTK